MRSSSPPAARSGSGVRRHAGPHDEAVRPIDGAGPVIPDRYLDVTGVPMNPAAREQPRDFIETGVSAIDLLASLVRGQKLPIFTGPGLPASELASRIATGSRLLGDERFVTIFGAMGVTRREADEFRRRTRPGSSKQSPVPQPPDDPAIERLLRPASLSLGEHLAFELGKPCSSS